MYKPEYYPDKGLACLRVEGLSPAWQTHENRPANRGIWAFIFPYFDWWFLSGNVSKDKFPKKKVEKHQYPKPRKFWAKGTILTRFEVPGSELLESGWYQTTDRELWEYLPKRFARDIRYLRISEKQCYPEFAKAAEIKHPFYRGQGGFLSVDQMEVFVPMGTKIG